MISDDFGWKDAAMAVCGIGLLAVGVHILAPAFAVPTIWSYFAGAKTLTAAGAVLGGGSIIAGAAMTARGLRSFIPSFMKPSLG